MSKWKCEICDSEFENYHAQGFEHKIYCPLCYFKELNNRKDKEIERLKNGYCELKEKCNNGECDCTNEEYDGMAERNLKLSLEIERLNNIINELEEWIEEQHQFIIELPAYTKEISIEHKIMKNDYENVLYKLKELKESNK